MSAGAYGRNLGAASLQTFSAAPECATGGWLRYSGAACAAICSACRTGLATSPSRYLTVLNLQGHAYERPSNVMRLGEMPATQQTGSQTKAMQAPRRPGSVGAHRRVQAYADVWATVLLRILRLSSATRCQRQPRMGYLQARALAHALATLPLAMPQQPGAALQPADLRSAPAFTATVLEYCPTLKQASAGAIT